MFRKSLFLFMLMMALNHAAHAMVAYLGLEGGVNSGNWKLENTQDDDVNFNANGPDGGVFAGLGFIIEPNFYLGLEGFGNINGIKTPEKMINTNTLADLHSNWSVGLSAIPGHYIFQNTMLYLRIGLVDTDFVLDIADDSESDDILGAQFGLGVQTKFIKNLDLRLEYVYSTYRHWGTLGYHIYPQNNLFNLGILYRFDDHPYRSTWVKNPEVAEWNGRRIINTGKYSQFPKNAFNNLVNFS